MKMTMSAAILLAMCVVTTVASGYLAYRILYATTRADTPVQDAVVKDEPSAMPHNKVLNYVYRREHGVLGDADYQAKGWYLVTNGIETFTGSSGDYPPLVNPDNYAVRVDGHELLPDGPPNPFPRPGTLVLPNGDIHIVSVERYIPEGWFSPKDPCRYEVKDVNTGEYSVPLWEWVTVAESPTSPVPEGKAFVSGIEIKILEVLPLGTVPGDRPRYRAQVIGKTGYIYPWQDAVRIEGQKGNTVSEIRSTGSNAVPLEGKDPSVPLATIRVPDDKYGTFFLGDPPNYLSFEIYIDSDGHLDVKAPGGMTGAAETFFNHLKPMVDSYIKGKCPKETTP